MNRIARRAVIVFLLALGLIVGMGFFLYDYCVHASQWVIFPGNPHIYNGSNIDCGTVTDAEGTVLLNMTDGRYYSIDQQLRESTVHWLGDRYGYISAPAVADHTEDLVGYTLWNGLYSYTGGLGGTAKLTLVGSVQKAAMDALGNYNGTVGVYNYRTGEILCAVTKPSYDPDNVPEIDDENAEQYDGIYVNRFIQSTYTPGSIFKIATTAAALDSIDDIEDYTFLCEGIYMVGSDYVTCENYHGYQTLQEAMCNSCNCAYAKLAEILGEETIAKYVEKLKLTEPVSFDGITTAEGYFNIKNAEQVYVNWAAIGQYTDLINPCRFMVTMGAIAAGGSAAVPHVVQEINVGWSTTYKAKTVMEESILDGKTAQTLRAFMRNNVANNYGDFHFPGMTVCAKSGTSQQDGEGRANAMFAGFVTDEDYPLAFIMIVENGGYGGVTCPPMMGKILEACKSYMDGQ